MTIHTPGRHGLLDLYGCPPELLCSESSLKTALIQAAQATQATILFSHFHNFGNGQGITGVLLLAESHISIHTWPEHQFAAADIFLCGTLNPATAAHILQTALCAQSIDWQEHQRGKNINNLSGSLKP